MSEKSGKNVTINPIFSSIEENEKDPPLLNDDKEPLFTEQSPFEEVSSNVSNHDDPSMLCFTFRSFFLGIFFSCILPFVNQFFSFRTSPLVIDTVLVQLIAYPLGRLLATILPTRIFHPFGNEWQFSFNPGSFTIKEHTIIATMASAASVIPVGIHVITIQTVFYKHSISFVHGLFFILSSQILGFGLAGIMRRFLIWPANMIWPENLIYCALLRVLHTSDEDDKKSNTSRWTMSRFHFFYMAMFFQALWYWIPGFICPVLSYFSLFCMLFPHNIIISQITGVNGLGFSSFELDWNAWVSFLGSPIAVPLWAQINIIVGFVIIVWIIAPIGYYSNWWNAQALPIASYQLFTREGYIYDVKQVLDSHLQLNQSAYKIYGEMRLPILFALSYATQFAAITAIIVHTLLYHAKKIYQQYQSSLVDTGSDIHAKLMRQYVEVPSWWYTSLFLIVFIVTAITCQYGQLMPWYFLFVDMTLVLIFLLPTGLLVALSNVTLGLNVISEFIAGIIIPGNPIANATFKTYAYGSQSQAIILLSRLKFGHYMKIPPRTMFLTQILATIIGSSISYSTALYLLHNVPHICTPQNPEWKCPGPTTFFSASIIWGVIGPIRMFGFSSIYSPLLLGFILGALLPIPGWFLLKEYPENQWLKYVHVPVMLSGLALLPTAPAGEYPSWFAVGFFFNFVLFRYAHSWWKRYAFLFSAAMSCGVAISALLIFFVLQNNNIYFPQWWGTGGVTGDGCPLANGNLSGHLPHYKSL